jgi:CheY-like chemotaxis protein
MPNESESGPPTPARDERSHFLAHMGHDLRSPMTNILALTEALVDGVYGPLAPAQSETLKHIRDNGHRMINMVTDLVDLARFETGQINLEPAPCDVMEPCRSGVAPARGIAKSKNVTIESELNPPSVQAVADARRLRQLMAGLASAAVVSAPAEGRVFLRVQADTAQGALRLEAHTEKKGYQTSPSEKSASASPPSAAALQKLRKMSAVAVAMLEKIVGLHQGTVGVSEREAGSISIYVELPLAFPDFAKGGTLSTDDNPSVSTSLPFILLADDEEIIRTITKDYLESTGYRVACVTNGREALDFIQKETPDLVIMDMQMPVLDGMEALVQLRRLPDARVARTPVISLSGLATPGHRERSLAAGANACLAKPFGIKDLEKVIKDTLGGTA